MSRHAFVHSLAFVALAVACPLAARAAEGDALLDAIGVEIVADSELLLPPPEATPAPVPAPAATPAAPVAATAPEAPSKAGEKAGEKAAETPPANDGADAQAAAAAALLGPQSGIQLTASYSLNAGVQIDDDMTSASQSLAVGLNYKLHPKVFFAASFSPYHELTAMPGDNRRFGIMSGGTFARLNFRNLLRSESLGVGVGGNVTYQLPLGYNDWLVGNPRFGALGAAVQVFKPVGDLLLILSGGTSTPLFEYAQPYEVCDPATRTNGTDCLAAPEGFPGAPTGFWNERYRLSTGLAAIYNGGPVTLFGSFGLSRAYSYAPSESLNPRNQVLPHNQRHGFSFVAQVSYALNDHFSLNTGVFNAGPQLDDLMGYNNFLFDKTLASVFAGVDWVQ